MRLSGWCHLRNMAHEGLSPDMSRNRKSEAVLHIDGNGVIRSSNLQHVIRTFIFAAKKPEGTNFSGFKFARTGALAHQGSLQVPYFAGMLSNFPDPSS
jgi:hypothetical protein